ncbi:hypothetical protein N7478_000727 [Penicillium angulare]|uniref:uncharacterized protein n=1 Tax=Penicillium angulare TaxID=116970 RepID=UPI00254132FE|nr:uncharacterized protein N7478_000727 [Penicillium angulare]KAJ5291476.1 hypothetical protein N7478_000727 [Penicillium angulare]
MPCFGLDENDSCQNRFLRPGDETPSYAPTPGYFDHEDASSIECLPLDREESVDARMSPFSQTQPDRVGVRQTVEPQEVSHEQPLDCIEYPIEWRLTLNRRVVAQDTEQNLIQMPSFHWSRIQARAEKILRGKIARDRRVRADDVTVVVSVNDRSQRDLTKRFDSTDVDWSAIEKQLLMWANLHRLGKELRLKISLNFIEDSSLPSRCDKRGKSSVTKRMLADRDAQIDAEDVSGQPSVWRDVYQKMRCPGPPCRHEGQYCWQDPVGKRHYKLRTHQLRSLVKYVEKGGTLETHDDVPDSIREQLYTEENERRRKQKSHDFAHNAPGPFCPPINITVLPNQASQPLVADSIDSATYHPKISTPGLIEIPGLHDVAVEEYSDWQQSRVSRENLKDDIRKARDLALANGLDLQQIHGDQNPEFFTKQGISLGVARRFVSEIVQWAQLGTRGRE